MEIEQLMKRLRVTKNLLANRQGGQHPAFVQEAIDKLEEMKSRILELEGKQEVMDQELGDQPQTPPSKWERGDPGRVDEYGTENSGGDECG